MTKNLLYNDESLFAEIKERAEAAGIASREEWNALVEEVIEDRRGVGEFDDDEDLEALEDALKEHYGEYEESLRVE